MIIVIDDERTFEDEQFDDAIYLRTSQAAIYWLALYITRAHTAPIGATTPIQEIWFDHDLGEKSEDDSVVVADFLGMMISFTGETDLFYGLKLYIHTQNPVGGEVIKNTFKKYHLHSERVDLPNCCPPH